LFAALNIANGEVRARHHSHRRRIEFLDFMNRVAAEHSRRQIHVILDNLNTHNTTVGSSGIPTSSSTSRRPAPRGSTRSRYWFSILADQSLVGASCTSVAQLRAHIDSFIEA
jgi:hypothetical protein